MMHWQDVISVQRKHKADIIEIATWVVLVATYIIPTGIIATQYQISKLFFVGCIFLLYVIYCAQSLRVNKREMAMIVFLIIATIVSRNINFLVFITLPFANIMVQKKDRIIQYLKSSNILYVCLLFTIIYSIGSYVFLPIQGNEDHKRLVRTAIVEINQSGLSIFCLGVMLRKKNKLVSISVFIIGLLTESRSYFLALFIYFFSKTKLAHKIINMIKTKKWTYFKLTLITNVLLLLAGYIYIYLYQHNQIIPYVQGNRTFALNDYSNFFRFSLIVLLCYVITKEPRYLLFGLSDEEYIKQLGLTAKTVYNIPYAGNQPHNLFFSHLQKYGMFSLIEAYYVSTICRKIITKSNFLVYIALVLYSVLLGAGMYSYWLYLSIFALLTEM